MVELKFLNIGILSWITFIPLLGALVILALPNEQSQNIKRIAGAAALIQLIFSILLLIYFNSAATGFNTIDSFQFIEKWKWIDIQTNGSIPAIIIEYFLAADGLSVTFIFLTSLASFLCILASCNNVQSVKAFFILFLFADTAITGTLVSADLFLFFIFFSVSLLPVYFLTGIFGKAKRTKTSGEFLIQAFTGGMIIFFVILILFFSSNDTFSGFHSFSIISLSEHKNIIDSSIIGGTLTVARLICLAALFIGFALRLPLFPFHSRFIDTMNELPSHLAAFFAGTFIITGFYGILKMALPLFPDSAIYFAYMMGLWGAINIIYGTFCMLAQNDLKKITAYYSMLSSGFILLGLASYTVQGLSGSVFQLFNSVVILTMLFIISGIIQIKTGSANSDEFVGLYKKMPVFFILAIFCFFGAAGLSGLNSFNSAVLIFSGVFEVNDFKLAAYISLFGIIIASIFLILLFKKIFFGKTSQNTNLIDINLKDILILLPIALIILILGIFPSLILNIISNSVSGLASIISNASNVRITGW